MLLDNETDGFLRQRLPVLSSMSQQGGVATAFVCQDFTCSLPVTDALDLRRLLLDGTIDTPTAWPPRSEVLSVKKERMLKFRIRPTPAYSC